MVKKLYFLAILGFLSVESIMACDACGCGAGLTGMGLLTNYRVNSLYLGYNLAKYTGDPQFGDGSTDRFHSLDVNFRYYLSNRFTAQASLPYRWNERTVFENNQQLQGLSDAQLTVGYVLLNGQSDKENATLFLEVTAGLQAPTGNYDPVIHEEDLPENFNVGKGSWAFVQRNNMVFSKRYLGLVASTNVVINGTSTGGYRFGNQYSIQGLAYWEKRITGTLSVIPKVGVYAEKTEKDRYANELSVHGTGGSGLFLSFGGNLRIDRIQLGVVLYQPVVQHYSDDELSANTRYSIQLGYNF